MAWLGKGAQRFDRLLLLCIAVVGIIYVVSAWSPSSYAIVLRHLEAADDGLILGQPRAIRGDEFGWQTPLFQMAVNNGFRRFDATPPYFQDLRGLFGIPILDWGLLFKPNVWGFFALPPAFAYSLYEFSLVAMLMVGFTFLFATAGGSRLNSLLMALVVFFTPYTQYWWNGFANFFLPFFPWLVLIVVCDARPMLKWPLYYWLLTSCMLSYFYPPVLISLAFAGGVLVVALRPESLNARTLIPLLVASAMSAGTAAYYLRDTLTALAATIYPGQRLLPGGGVSFEIWVSQFLPTSQMHRHQSLIGINICEISTMASIYALAVLCFLDYRRLFQLKDSNRMAWTVGVLTAGVLVTWCWMMLPIPNWAGTLLLWHRVPPRRIVVATGVLLLTLAFIVASRFGLRVSLVRGGVLSTLIVIGWYVFKYRRSGISLAASWLDVALVPVIFLIAVLYWYGKLEPTRAHTVVLATAVALGVATTGTFNPVQSTKPIFTRHDTAVTRELDRRLAESPTGLLVVPFRSSFFGHTGLPLVGLGYPSVTYHTFVPNLTFWQTLFPDLPTDEFHSVFNNAGGFSVDDIAAPYRELDRAVTIVPNSTFSGPGAADHVRRAVEASRAAARKKGGARVFRVDAPIKITNGLGRDRQPG